MSRQHLNHYRRTLVEQHRITGSLNEGVVSKAFADLLERTGRSRDLIFSPQWEGRGPRGNAIRVDGALVPSILRVPFGYWEAKDEKDDLDREIAAKLSRGYPDDNIIYEDTRTAVLRQDGREVMRVSMRDDDDALLRLLDRFYAYERPELTEFKAAAKFRADLPRVLEALRHALGEAEARSASFARALADFLAHAKQAINPAVSADDVREMLIQHILTEEIFASVFDNAQYHRENNVARQLGELEAKFFTGALRHATTERLRPYYGAIRHAASALADRRAKQDFIKRLYEDFYKVYNPEAADRLGVVYTPGEIVRFMIRGAEWLTERHFGKVLSDRGVEILDPATGTGTFIVELLEHMQGAGPDHLRQKYKEDMHANELAILSYYVANLNIESTFAALTGQYAVFDGLVFVDTLDNTAGLGIYKGYQGGLFGDFGLENFERLRRQNDRKISVIMGNPPYNAWQSDYRSKNPNRPYQQVDRRITQTYRRRSRAKNTISLSDMYVRFWRWATDRLENDGIVAFVTNRNFIDRVAFDGFRLSVADDFVEAWVMDLGGDVRANPKLSGTKHNVFGIQTGVAIAFFVRKQHAGKFRLFYARRPEEEEGSEKLAYLDQATLSERTFAALKPDGKGSWLSGDHPDWKGFLALADPSRGPGDVHGANIQAIFRLSSNGVVTQRDDWMWAHDRKALSSKVTALIKSYEQVRTGHADADASTLKWDRELDRYLNKKVAITYRPDCEILAQYRPFGREWLYFDPHLNGMTYRLPSLYRSREKNPGLVVSDKGWRSSFAALATDVLPDTHMIASIDRYFVVTRYRYTKSGERVDNITDWALAKFRERYPAPLPFREGLGVGTEPTGSGSAASTAPGACAPVPTPGPSPEGRGEVTKDDIFAYCYAALHDPAYRETHADDLRREFPRIPFHEDFWTWRDWGETLLKLHIDYEQVDPWPLTRADAPGDRTPAPKLKSHPDRGLVIVDTRTQLTGIPPEAWTYRLGNRSAIDWVLDQHKEKTIRDPTVRAKFNTYRFADHKETMIALLARVVRVSMETVAIVHAMRAGAARA